MRVRIERQNAKIDGTPRISAECHPQQGCSPEVCEGVLSRIEIRQIEKNREKFQSPGDTILVQTMNRREKAAMRRSSKTDHQWLRMLLGVGTDSVLSDAELLDRFLSRFNGVSEDAFKSLLQRHGPMVLSVCSRILSDPQDSEDAFQATFLILATRAQSIRAQGSVASWLHGVALRVASHLRKTTGRRRAKERRLTEMAGQRVDPKATREEEVFLDHEAVHQEVQRLPRKYREVIVLCYLQGVTQEAAADQLRCPATTVGVRLMRARAQLKARLSRRGLSRPGGEVLTPLLLWYSLPPMDDSLVRSTTKLVMGTGGKSSSAAHIAAVVLGGTVVTARIRIAIVVLVAALATASFGGALAGMASWIHQTDPSPVATKDSAPPPVVTKASATSRNEGRSVDSDQTRPIALHDSNQVMVVAGSVPEPSTLVMVVTAGVIIGGYACLRRGKPKLPGVLRAIPVRDRGHP
jgi:RNA polymerase sigma factor (sigma-70 family)